MFREIILVAFMTILALKALPADGEEWPYRIARQFCLDLSHPESDSKKCFGLKSQYSVGKNNNRQIIPYLCCLGVLGDLQRNYTQIISMDLIEYAVGAPNATYVLYIGQFIRACQSSATSSSVLTRNDYFTWLSRGLCRVNW